jgi:uncharacterized repeat protein (TIGR01451 family)
MQPTSFIQKLSSFPKIVKLNVLLLVTLMIAATMSVTFATDGSVATYGNDCGARVALVLDRSSSIGVDQFSGSAANSQANVDAIKVGANTFVDAIIGKDSYTDVYAFASVAQRVNSGGWFNVKDQDSANWQKLLIGGLKFKRGATSGAENAYDDGMNAAGEGLTNWAWALNEVASQRQDPFPTHLVMFTDGNPTTNAEHTVAAIRAGGSYTAAGYPQEDGDADGSDLAAALRSADFLRALGIKIIPVGVGNVNTANLQKLAGAGNPVYYASNYSQLTQKFREAAANVCEEPSTPAKVLVHATDEQGKLLAAQTSVTASGAFKNFPENGATKTTSTSTANPWAAQWALDTTGNWGVSVAATQAPAGYEPVGDRCRRDNWNQAGAVDLTQANGSQSNPSRVDVTPLAKGGTIYCQFIYRPIPKDGIQLDKTVNPTTAKRGEAVTYSFVVKNTGNTKLTNIKVTDPMLGGLVGTVAELAPGASSAPVTKSYTIPNDATGTIRNVAVAEGTPIGPDGKARPVVKDDDPADVVVQLRPGSAIEKTVTPTVASVGTEVTYTITVKNTGETVLSNVIVFDRTLNKEVTVAGPIAPGASGSVQIKHVLTADNLKTGTFKNIACIKDTETCDDAIVTEPKVELTKTGPVAARPGEKVTYKFTVKNTGKTDLTDIEITDETLSEYTDAPVIIKISGTLKPGQTSEQKTYDFTIPADYEGNMFKNVAVVHATPIDPTSGQKVPGSKVTDDDDHTIALIRWEATKTADKDVTVPGDEVTYTITVKNTGGTALTNIEVSDPTIDFDTVLIESLLPGESKSVNAKYTIPADFDGNSFKNVALVCVPFEGQDDDCQEPEAEVDIARLSITKTADKESAFPGEKVTYTFVVKNNGGATIDPTEINDDILGVIGDPGELAPGESETFTKEFTVPEDAEDQSEIKNTATVCAPVPGTQEDETLTDTDCVTTCPADSVTTLCDQDDHVLLVEIPSITVVKTADKESASEGEEVVYTFVVTNTSKVTLTDIEVIDNVLGDLGNIDELEPGQSVERIVPYIVPEGAALEGTIRNVVTACFLSPEWSDNCATDDHSIEHR